MNNQSSAKQKNINASTLVDKRIDRLKHVIVSNAHEPNFEIHHRLCGNQNKPILPILECTQQMKSCDAEHDDALPNLIDVETNNNEHQRKNASTRNEINKTIDCHNNKKRLCVICFIDTTTTSKSQLARHYTSRSNSRTPQELQ